MAVRKQAKGNRNGSPLVSDRQHRCEADGESYPARRKITSFPFILFMKTLEGKRLLEHHFKSIILERYQRHYTGVSGLFLTISSTKNACLILRSEIFLTGGFRRNPYGNALACVVHLRA